MDQKQNKKQNVTPIVVFQSYVSVFCSRHFFLLFFPQRKDFNLDILGDQTYQFVAAGKLGEMFVDVILKCKML